MLLRRSVSTPRTSRRRADGRRFYMEGNAVRKLLQARCRTVSDHFEAEAVAPKCRRLQLETTVAQTPLCRVPVQKLICKLRRQPSHPANDPARQLQVHY